MAKEYCPNGELPKDCRSWKEAFGRVYADIQIHATQRGFIDGLYKFGAGHLVYRYRIDWRSESVRIPKKFGATHGADMAIWFLGDGRVLSKGEEEIVKEGFIDDMARFVNGERMEGWEGLKANEARRLKSDGTVDVWRDDKWEDGLKVWNAIISAPENVLAEQRAKL